MTDETCARSSPWRNVATITVLFCLLWGYPNFGMLAPHLTKTMELRFAAAWLGLGFGLSSLVLLLLILAWLRRSGRSMKDLTWASPTTPLAVVVGVVFAAAWLGMSYMNNQRLGVEFPLAEVSLLRIGCGLVMAFVGIVEEVALRGVVMTELNRAKVATWLQILISGFCFALYHSVQFLTNPQMLVWCLIPSMVVGSLFAGIYVLGKRSLTPCVVSHGLLNLVGEPFILMGALAAFGEFGS